MLQHKWINFSTSVKLFEVRLLDCRFVGCSRPECDCVFTSAHELARCQCQDTKTSWFNRPSDDTSWPLPTFRQCVFITVLVLILDIPVFILWYKEYKREIHEAASTAKRRVSVVCKL